MRRFIITGTPGAGKTAIIRKLALDGFSVVEEAATDVIAAAQAAGVQEPWKDPGFIDSIVSLQRQRRIRASSRSHNLQFHDRSPVCTAALAAYLGHPQSATLRDELEEIRTERFFESRVFFIHNLGFITPSEARRITLEEARRFEQIHEETYRSFGFHLIPIEAATLLERVRTIKVVAGGEFMRLSCPRCKCLTARS